MTWRKFCRMFAYLLTWVSFPGIEGILKKICWKWQWKRKMSNVKFRWFSPQIYLHWIATALIIMHFVIGLIEYYDFVSAAVFNNNKTYNRECVLKKGLQPQSIDRNRWNDLKRVACKGQPQFSSIDMWYGHKSNWFDCVHWNRIFHTMVECRLSFHCSNR